ncbi:MAG: SIS domain-containing protein [Acidimicrobiales bacterium]
MADDADHPDSLGMREALHARPERVRRILDTTPSLEGLPDKDQVSNVVVIGMGEAALAGDLVRAVAGPFMSVPLVVHRGYELPSFVAPDTLVLALSVSGSTDETVEATEAAFEAGAHLVSVTRADGHLADLARSWRTPLVELHDDVGPRLEFVPLSVAALIALEQMGFYPGGREWIEGAADQLARRRDQLSRPDQVVTRLSRGIGRTIPLVYGAGPIGQVAALRWKQQFNLTAKIPAFTNFVPELCHNEIAGWGQHGDVTRQVFTQIDLRHDDEHPNDTARFAQVDEITLEVVADILSVHADGDGTLAQLLDLVYIGDLVAVDIAVREGVDPGPAPAVEAVRITAD